MRRITMLALVVVLALLGAACGGDDDSTGSGDDGTTADGGDGGSSTDDGSGDTGGDDGGDDDIGDLIDDDCEFLLAGAFANPLAGAQSGDEDFEESAAQLQAIADDAPDEISDAMSTLAEGFTQMAEIFQDIDLSDPSSLNDPDTQAAMEELESIATDEYEAAAEEVNTWMAENCTGVVGG